MNVKSILKKIFKLKVIGQIFLFAFVGFFLLAFILSFRPLEKQIAGKQCKTGFAPIWALTWTFNDDGSFRNRSMTSGPSDSVSTNTDNGTWIVQEDNLHIKTNGSTQTYQVKFATIGFVFIEGVFLHNSPSHETRIFRCWQLN